jgi:hypothetical protein
MSIAEFIAACDRFCETRDVTRVWLSKRLLADTYKLDHLASGAVDIGVRRLERACADLEELERTHTAPDSQPGAAA